MFSTYDEAIFWIESRLMLGIKPGLMRMEWLMERLGHPERKLKAVHVGGTNGKGSTVTFLRSILEQAGYETGTFTSPYIEQFNERISINGQPISEAEILELVNVMYPLVMELEDTEYGGATEFEIITAMAFYYFAEIHPVDIAIIEVGLGGRLDSTNILQPLLSIITNIGLDHVRILGTTHKEIAYEKAGIIKQGTSLISAVSQLEAQEVIFQHAKKQESAVYLLNDQFTILDHISIDSGEKFTWQYEDITIQDISISMYGKHQTENASLAIMAAYLLQEEHSLRITEQQLREGLKSAYWPGRFEMVSQNPVVILDGAHNEEGITALTAELDKRYYEQKIKIIFSALGDKSLEKMIARLDSVADKITFVTFDHPRSTTAENLYNLSTLKNKHIAEDWQQTLTEELRSLEENEILVVTGSLYFIKQVKALLKEMLIST
ncbi:bifunctional folylpolyglutamate synthase/dihydrofolate synthase [Bacillus benzoevorans]|uniref:Dihydrofolate synthase/folylpolyglutamate synthase n=1 Tax=Bacillus benzoevorans TaxID=1456 RepID=A0A7X0HS39_9BACI|nr:folylpolyglutamate synthase/dihydrofolate synthase family protein [Bacillus benzoevorans]MBB6445852.1 dihydrofolate synthase/folylpolyglutamate synthase [Bacillus benzoevorans]